MLRVLAHASRRLWSWLIFDVGQNMNAVPFQVCQAPASEGDLSKLAAECGALPTAYLAFLRASNGAECAPHDAPGDSLRILSAAEVSQFNTEYQIARFLPDFLCFASDGGDYAFAFRKIGAVDEWPVVRIPLGALLRSEVTLISRSFLSWQEAEYRYSTS